VSFFSLTKRNFFLFSKEDFFFPQEVMVFLISPTPVTSFFFQTSSAFFFPSLVTPPFSRKLRPPPFFNEGEFAFFPFYESLLCCYRRCSSSFLSLQKPSFFFLGSFPLGKLCGLFQCNRVASFFFSKFFFSVRFPFPSRKLPLFSDADLTLTLSPPTGNEWPQKTGKFFFFLISFCFPGDGECYPLAESISPSPFSFDRRLLHLWAK